MTGSFRVDLFISGLTIYGICTPVIEQDKHRGYISAKEHRQISRKPSVISTIIHIVHHRQKTSSPVKSQQHHASQNKFPIIFESSTSFPYMPRSASAPLGGTISACAGPGAGVTNPSTPFIPGCAPTGCCCANRLLLPYPPAFSNRCVSSWVICWPFKGLLLAVFESWNWEGNAAISST